MNWSTRSITGKRNNNEDSCGVFSRNDGTLLLVVADGMGGHQAGEVASSMAIETVHHYFDSVKSISDPGVFLSTAVSKANVSVFSKSESDARYSGMGTTLVIGLIIDDILYSANVGDSRLYLFRKNKIEQITKDHAFVQELVDNGKITAEEARIHPMRNYITRCIGNSLTAEPDLFITPLQNGDVVLLCSDGLSGVLEADKLCDLILNRSGSSDLLAESLVHTAFNSGSTDNITVCVYFHESEVLA